MPLSDDIRTQLHAAIATEPANLAEAYRKMLYAQPVPAAEKDTHWGNVKAWFGSATGGGMGMAWTYGLVGGHAGDLMEHAPLGKGTLGDIFHHVEEKSELGAEFLRGFSQGPLLGLAEYTGFSWFTEVWKGLYGVKVPRPPEEIFPYQASVLFADGTTHYDAANRGTLLPKGTPIHPEKIRNPDALGEYMDSATHFFNATQVIADGSPNYTFHEGVHAPTAGVSMILDPNDPGGATYVIINPANEVPGLPVSAANPGGAPVMVEADGTNAYEVLTELPVPVGTRVLTDPNNPNYVVPVPFHQRHLPNPPGRPSVAGDLSVYGEPQTPSARVRLIPNPRANGYFIRAKPEQICGHTNAVTIALGTERARDIIPAGTHLTPDHRHEDRYINAALFAADENTPERNTGMRDSAGRLVFKPFKEGAPVTPDPYNPGHFIEVDPDHPNGYDPDILADSNPAIHNIVRPSAGTYIIPDVGNAGHFVTVAPANVTHAAGGEALVGGGNAAAYDSITLAPSNHIPVTVADGVTQIGGLPPAPHPIGTLLIPDTTPGNAGNFVAVNAAVNPIILATGTETLVGGGNPAAGDRIILGPPSTNYIRVTRADGFTHMFAQPQPIAAGQMVLPDSINRNNFIVVDPTKLVDKHIIALVGAINKERELVERFQKAPLLGDSAIANFIGSEAFAHMEAVSLVFNKHEDGLNTYHRTFAGTAAAGIIFESFYEWMKYKKYKGAELFRLEHHNNPHGVHEKINGLKGAAHMTKEVWEMISHSAVELPDGTIRRSDTAAGYIYNHLHWIGIQMVANGVGFGLDLMTHHAVAHGLQTKEEHHILEEGLPPTHLMNLKEYFAVWLAVKAFCWGDIITLGATMQSRRNVTSQQHPFHATGQHLKHFWRKLGGLETDDHIGLLFSKNANESDANWKKRLNNWAIVLQAAEFGTAVIDAGVGVGFNAVYDALNTLVEQMPVAAMERWGRRGSSASVILPLIEDARRKNLPPAQFFAALEAQLRTPEEAQQVATNKDIENALLKLRPRIEAALTQGEGLNGVLIADAAKTGDEIDVATFNANNAIPQTIAKEFKKLIDATNVYNDNIREAPGLAESQMILEQLETLHTQLSQASSLDEKITALQKTNDKLTTARVHRLPAFTPEITDDPVHTEISQLHADIWDIVHGSMNAQTKDSQTASLVRSQIFLINKTASMTGRMSDEQKVVVKDELTKLRAALPDNENAIGINQDAMLDALKAANEELRHIRDVVRNVDKSAVEAAAIVKADRAKKVEAARNGWFRKMANRVRGTPEPLPPSELEQGPKTEKQSPRVTAPEINTGPFAVFDMYVAAKPLSDKQQPVYEIFKEHAKNNPRKNTITTLDDLMPRLDAFRVYAAVMASIGFGDDKDVQDFSRIYKTFQEKQKKDPNATFLDSVVADTLTWNFTETSHELDVPTLNMHHSGLIKMREAIMKLSGSDTESHAQVSALMKDYAERREQLNAIAAQKTVLTKATEGIAGVVGAVTPAIVQYGAKKVVGLANQVTLTGAIDAIKQQPAVTVATTLLGTASAFGGGIPAVAALATVVGTAGYLTGDSTTQDPNASKTESTPERDPVEQAFEIYAKAHEIVWGESIYSADGIPKEENIQAFGHFYANTFSNVAKQSPNAAFQTVLLQYIEAADPVKVFGSIQNARKGLLATKTSLKLHNLLGVGPNNPPIKWVKGNSVDPAVEQVKQKETVIPEVPVETTKEGLRNRKGQSEDTTISSIDTSLASSTSISTTPAVKATPAAKIPPISEVEDDRFTIGSGSESDSDVEAEDRDLDQGLDASPEKAQTTPSIKATVPTPPASPSLTALSTPPSPALDAVKDPLTKIAAIPPLPPSIAEKEVA
ncbi:MAG: hypothetical protein V4568_07130, partial [Pseudomonadota bacterium]